MVALTSTRKWKICIQDSVLVNMLGAAEGAGPLLEKSVLRCDAGTFNLQWLSLNDSLKNRPKHRSIKPSFMSHMACWLALLYRLLCLFQRLLNSKTRGSLLERYRGGAWGQPSNIPILRALGWAHKLHVDDLLKSFSSALPELPLPCKVSLGDCLSALESTQTLLLGWQGCLRAGPSVPCSFISCHT